MSVKPRRDRDDDTVTVSRDEVCYVAKDESSGVASQGESKAEALENLAEALRVHHRPIPEGKAEDLEPSSAPWFDE